MNQYEPNIFSTKTPNVATNKAITLCLCGGNAALDISTTERYSAARCEKKTSLQNVMNNLNLTHNL